MPDVFVSYSRRNSEFVHRVVDKLAERKRDVWVDWEDIPLTADWWQEIQQGIDESSAFVFVISPDSVQSEVCRQELDYAISNNKRFIPVLYEEIVTDEDKAAMHPKISSHNWLFFRDGVDNFDKAINALNAAIDLDLDHARNHTRFLVRAKEWNEKGKDKSFLMTGSEISEAEQWLAVGIDKQPKPLEIHTEYIFASRAAANQRQRTLLTGVTFALVVSLLLAIAAIIGFTQASAARDDAEQARDEAERERDIATSLNFSTSAQLAMNEADNGLAILLGLQATEIDNPPVQSSQILEEAAFAPGTRRTYPVHDVAGNTIYSVEASADDSLILSADRAGRILLWELASGEIQQEMNEEGRVRQAIFSPDETQILSSSDDLNIRLWGASTGEPIRTYTAEDGHEARAQALAFTPDGATFIAGDNNGVVLRWDVETGEIIQRYEDTENGHTSIIWDVAMMPDGATFIAVDSDGRVVEWDVESGAFVREFIAHTDAVLGVDINTAGTQLLTASNDRTVRLWDLETGNLIHTMQGHGGAIRAVEFSPVGLYAVSGADDTVVIIWDLNTGTEIYRFAANEGFITAIAFLSDGRSVLSASGFDALTRLWDVVPGANMNRYFGHSGAVSDVLITDNGSRIISSGDRVIQWDVETGEQVLVYGAESEDGHTDDILELAFGANQEVLATAGFDQTIKLWNTTDGTLIRTLADSHSGAISALAFSSDGATLATGDAGEAPNITLWDVATGDLINTINVTIDGDPVRLQDVAISPDGTLLVAALENGAVTFYDLETLEEIEMLTGHSGPAIDVDFSPDGSLLASVSQDTNAIIWDVANRSIVRTIADYTQPLNSVDFNPDGTTLLIGSDDGSIRLWDVNTGAELRRVITPNSSVERVKFQSDGVRVATAHEDGTVQLWSLPRFSLAELKAWALENRNIPTFTQEECDRFAIDTCDLPIVDTPGA